MGRLFVWRARMWPRHGRTAGLVVSVTCDCHGVLLLLGCMQVALEWSCGGCACDCYACISMAFGRGLEGQRQGCRALFVKVRMCVAKLCIFSLWWVCRVCGGCLVGGQMSPRRCLKSPRSNYAAGLQVKRYAFVTSRFVMPGCTSHWLGGAAAVHMAAVCYFLFKGLERLVVGGIRIAATSLA